VGHTRGQNDAVRRAVLLLLALVGGVALAVGPARPAHAHASLESSSPAANSVLDEPPTDITLDFDEPVTAQDGGIRLLDSSAAPIELGSAEQGSDSTVVVAAVPEIPDGAYVVACPRTVIRCPGRSRSRSGGRRPSTPGTCWPRS
jgi:copper transport protein